jgi:REP element-mobilizing transposase RayT
MRRRKGDRLGRPYLQIQSSQMEAGHQHHRRSIRLRDYDYRQSGAYYVTVCADERRCLFGEIVNDEMQLNPAGEIVESVWEQIPQHFPNTELDAFVIMPNHVHGILLIIGDERGISVGATDSVAPTTRFVAPPKGSLGVIISQFKSVATKQIRKALNRPDEIIWQRNYYERIVRNARELEAFRDYIRDNPMQWALDRENPNNAQDKK